MEPLIPISRIPGGIIVATLSGRTLAPIQYSIDPQRVEETPKIVVTTLRALVGAKVPPTIREVFAKAA